MKVLHDTIKSSLPNIDTIEYSPTGGCSMKKGAKFINIVPQKGKIEFLLTRTHENNYYRPQITGLNILNIRKYDPTVKSYTIPWGYQNYMIHDDVANIKSNEKVILDLIKRSYETANQKKILKVNETNHHLLEKIFKESYTIE